MSEPLVSVVLPTYNREAYLPEAVASVLQQTERRWELLLADDGSTDRTPEYLARITDPRVRVMRLDHCGHPGAVRNRALAVARGRYVAFLDSDDWWEPEKLAAQLAALERHPRCGWSYTSFRLLARDGGAASLVRVPPAPADGMVLEPLVAGSAAVLTSTVMTERRLLESAGGFEPAVTVASDLDMWVRLAQISPAWPVPEVLATKRQHAGNYTLAYGESLEVLDRVSASLLSRVESPRARAIIRARRAGWLVRAADRYRNEGQYREAWRALASAVRSGARGSQWSRAALKLLVQPLIPRRWLRRHRGRRTRAS